MWARYMETRDSKYYKDYQKARKKVKKVPKKERKIGERGVGETILFAKT